VYFGVKYSFNLPDRFSKLTLSITAPKSTSDPGAEPNDVTAKPGIFFSLFLEKIKKKMFIKVRIIKKKK
jgi:hypothetical protein